MRWGDQRGVTLVELLVAVSIFVVLAVASATLYSTIVKVYVKDKVTQDLQREGDAVLANMSQNLKEATEVDTTNSNFTTDPNALQVKLSTAGQTRRYYVTANQIHYVSEQGTDVNLLAPGTTVTSMTFSPTSTGTALKSVRINVSLSRTKSGQTVTLTVGSTVNTRPQ